jgi:hypothetical protein
MQIIDATAAVLMALAVFIGALAWQIRNSLEKLIQTQNEILAELVYARYRSSGSAEAGSGNPDLGRGQSLKAEGNILSAQVLARSAKA